ncbi:hypothetical protein BGX28_009910 [Mortierella sp. GBA30]|nr:hypothetical protein BGX28_009910 [Mortierella sp. GBA30]
MVNPGNKSVVLLKYPTEYPVAGEHIGVQHKEFHSDLLDGQVLLRNLYVSLDPYLRGRMNGVKDSYVPSYEIVGAFDSKNLKYPIGAFVTGSAIRWEERMPGLTAYGSPLSIGKPKAGETIFISAASGAVGQLVGQIAKLKSLHVIGSAGSDDKVTYLLNELKFDAAFNYRKNIVNIISKRLTIQGFLVLELSPEIPAQFSKDVREWLVNGDVIYKEDIANGLDRAPEAFAGLFRGTNFGKGVVKIA